MKIFYFMKLKFFLLKNVSILIFDFFSQSETASRLRYYLDFAPTQRDFDRHHTRERLLNYIDPDRTNCIYDDK